MQMICVLSQVYDSLSRPYPRRFVLPLHVSAETPEGQNLNTRPSSQATCVKVGKDKVSRSSRTVQLIHTFLLQAQCFRCT